MVPIEHVVGLAGLLFLIGAVGMLVRRHLVVLLMCVQLMWAAGTLAIVGFARLHGDENGHVFALLAIVAAYWSMTRNPTANTTSARMA